MSPSAIVAAGMFACAPCAAIGRDVAVARPSATFDLIAARGVDNVAALIISREDLMTALYDLSVQNYLQTLGAVAAFMDKAAGHFATHKTDLEEIVETRLFADMLPFRFQVQSVAHHSLGTIEALKSGIFLPPSNLAPHSFAELQKLIGDTRDTLSKASPEEINARAGKDVIFEIGGRKLPFIAENFVLSFSLPNFYFHAATAYDILRQKGVPLGKRDFIGMPRIKM
jgi:uncharacterized protein